MKKLLKKILVTLSLALALTSYSAPLTYATDFVQPTIVKPDLLPGPTADQLSENNQRTILTESVLPKFAIRLIGLISALALIFVIIGGVRYVTAYGDEEKISNAKNQVMYAIVGFIIAILSYTIVTIVINLQFEGDQASTAQGPPAPQIQQN